AAFISYGRYRRQVTQVTPYSWGVWAYPRCGPHEDGLAGPGGGVVAVLRGDLQSFLIHQNFDSAIGAAGRGLGGISKCVLVARLGGDFGVRIFYGIAGEFRVHLPASRRRCIFGKNVAGTLARQAELFDLAEAGKSAAVNDHGFHLDVM